MTSCSLLYKEESDSNVNDLRALTSVHFMKYSFHCLIANYSGFIPVPTYMYVNICGFLELKIQFYNNIANIAAIV